MWVAQHGELRALEECCEGRCTWGVLAMSAFVQGPRISPVRIATMQGGVLGLISETRQCNGSVSMTMFPARHASLHLAQPLPAGGFVAGGDVDGHAAMGSAMPNMATNAAGGHSPRGRIAVGVGMQGGKHAMCRSVTASAWASAARSRLVAPSAAASVRWVPASASTRSRSSSTPQSRHSGRRPTVGRLGRHDLSTVAAGSGLA